MATSNKNTNSNPGNSVRLSQL